MYDPYTHNAFRVLGLPAEIEPALLPTSMDPDNLPPLWQLSWMGPTDRSQEQVAKALDLLRDETRVKLAYRTWFRKETPIDQKAIKACEDGYWEGAADLWKGPAETNDQVALQNLAVLYHTRALSSSAAGNPVWAYWTRALDWWNKLVLAVNGEPEVIEVRERIIEDLMKLAHEQASRDSPEDVRLVLEIFRRAGMPDQRREQLQEELLSLELVRVKHLCNQVRESMPAVFRVGNPSIEKGVENIQKCLEEEIYPALDWLRKAAGGKLEEEARKEVARLLVSLSRAVRGRVGTGDMGFIQRAIELAPEGYHEELLQGHEELKEAPLELREEETARPERGFKPPAWAIVALLISLVLMGTGGYLMYQKQLRQERRAALIRTLNHTTEQAATIGGQLAATEKELAKQQRVVAAGKKKLEANPDNAAAKQQLKKDEARLADVKAKRDALKKQHQGLLSKLTDLQGELQKTR